MNSKGFTAIEMVIVVVLIGTIAAIGFPRIRDSIEKANRRAARTAVQTYLVTARSAAVARGCRSSFHFTQGPNSRMWVSSCAVNGAGRDTIAGPDQLEERWGVRLQSGRDSITYDPRGVRVTFVETTIKIRDKKDNDRDSVVVNQLGKVIYP
ncbi:MAG: pilus assembly FimT family protein [Candidatus Methylomirabilaceae bacterium]